MTGHDGEAVNWTWHTAFPTNKQPLLTSSKFCAQVLTNTATGMKGLGDWPEINPCFIPKFKSHSLPGNIQGLCMGSQKGQMGHRLSNPLQEDSSTKASGSVSKMAHLCDWQVGAGFLLFSRYDSSQSCLGFLTAWQQGFKKEISKRQKVETASFLSPLPGNCTSFPPYSVVKHSQSPDQREGDIDPIIH